MLNVNAGAAAIFVTVLSMVAGQSSIFAILPPLGRELGFSEIQVGIIVTASAFVAFLCSPWWGRRVPIYGPRKVILLGLSGSALCFMAMALFADLGLKGALPPATVFALMLLVRGILLGVFLAAVLVANYAAIAGLSTVESDRVKGFATVQMAYGLGNILGPLAGGFLAALGFVLALAVMPLTTVAGIVAVAFLLPRKVGVTEAVESKKMSALDPRVFPLLVIIFLVITPLAVSMVTLGFLTQDRLALAPVEAARMAGLAAFTVFASVSGTQIVVVRVLKWPAQRLVRTGCVFSFIGMVGLCVGMSAFWLYASMALVGIGIGLSQTGAMTLPTMAVDNDEQGALSGLLVATSTLAFTLWPVAATGLYTINNALPFAVTAALLAGLLVFLVRSKHPSLVSKKPT